MFWVGFICLHLLIVLLAWRVRCRTSTEEGLGTSELKEEDWKMPVDCYSHPADVFSFGEFFSCGKKNSRERQCHENMQRRDGRPFASTAEVERWAYWDEFWIQ